ncbi:MAG: hypothetical protein HYS09_08530 [Chloroflexi bacterium]|nr:hypothetical protein [Chloroflexota bacterium]
MSLWPALGPALDLATALCAAFNSAYFLHLLASRREEPARRVAAAALALVSLGAMVESAFFLLAGPPAGSPAWPLVRALPFAGTAAVSLLIMRRVITLDS